MKILSSSLQKHHFRSMYKSRTRVKRTYEDRRAQYELEKALALQLRESSREERKALYTHIYNEFFQKAPSFTHHSATLEKSGGVEASQWRFLRRFLDKESIFVEIGAGDCCTSLAVANVVKKVYALEVSEEATKQVRGPENFHLLFFDGFVLPDLSKSVDVIYSNQVMEHIHPDDAFEQLTAIYHMLSQGGCYVCVTPNRLTGPHDISQHFDPIATGFHLKEYTNTDLSALFKKVGFSRIKAYMGAEGFYWRFPLSLLILMENLLEKLPYQQRKMLARLCLFYNIRLVGIKK